jgi:hypothetical protein
MVGYPVASAQLLGNARVQTNTGTCNSGCDLDTAMTQGLVHNEAWAYDGTEYRKVTSGDNLEPWTAYWIAVLEDAHGLDPMMLVPAPYPSR